MIALDSTVSNRGDMQDRLRAALLSYKEREINLTIDDLIGKTGLTYSQIYQALYRLQRLGELEILREQDNNGKPRVAGVKLARMDKPEIVEHRNIERTTSRQADRDFTSVSVNVPNVVEYMNRKLAIEKARAEVMKANIDPDTVIRFNPDPIGEEAIYLLSKVQEMIETNRTLTTSLEAEKRNVSFLKEQRTTLYGDSGT